MKTLCSALIVLLFALPAFAGDPEPYIKSAPMPFYPPLARQAGIEGTVTLHIAVNKEGDTEDIEAVSGHNLLRAAASENVKGWKFGWPNPCFCKLKKDVTFVYRLSGNEESHSSPTVTVKWFKSKLLVEVEADLPHFETAH